MLAEAQWDKPRSRERQHVTACLRAQYDGAPILASMGSLAHYMQETSHAGFNLRDYIHEGIGQVWTSSLDMGARHHAGWVLIEEQAEGGDELAKLRDARPAFLAGFTRICEGGGVALYKRNAAAHANSASIATRRPSADRLRAFRSGRGRSRRSRSRPDRVCRR